MSVQTPGGGGPIGPIIHGGQSFFGTNRSQSLELAAAVGALLPDLAKAIRAIERENRKTRLSRRLREHEEALQAAIVGEALK